MQVHGNHCHRNAERDKKAVVPEQNQQHRQKFNHSIFNAIFRQANEIITPFHKDREKTVYSSHSEISNRDKDSNKDEDKGQTQKNREKDSHLPNTQRCTTQRKMRREEIDKDTEHRKMIQKNENVLIRYDNTYDNKIFIHTNRQLLHPGFDFQCEATTWRD